MTLENTETSALGQQYLPELQQVFENFQDACNKCVKLKYRYPDISKSSVYEVPIKYKEIYSSISHLYQAI